MSTLLDMPPKFRIFKIYCYLFSRRYPLLYDGIKWLLIGSLLAVCIGGASTGFLYSLNWVTTLREDNSWMLYFLPLSGLCIGYMYFLWGKVAAKGNNLLIDATINPNIKVPIIMAPLVYLGTLLTHLFGGSAGREGTALQMAGALSSGITKPFRLKNSDQSIVLQAAVAAGFGSVFGTPIAGAIFALEWCFIGRINYMAIFPVIYTAMAAHLVGNLLKAPHTHYVIDDAPTLDFKLLGYALLVGILFGWCAKFFSVSLKKVGEFYQKNISYTPIRPFVGGIVVVLLISVLGTMRYSGLGVPVIVEAFTTPAGELDFFWKLLLTVLTVGAGFKGGEVTPLFFIGATLGSALSLVIPLPTALLAGMGFVAVFAGATNTPIACTFMAIELFGGVGAEYMAIACVVAYLVSGRTSIYTHQMVSVGKNHRDVHAKGKSIGSL